MWPRGRALTWLRLRTLAAAAALPFEPPDGLLELATALAPAASTVRTGSLDCWPSSLGIRKEGEEAEADGRRPVVTAHRASFRPADSPTRTSDRGASSEDGDTKRRAGRAGAGRAGPPRTSIDKSLLSREQVRAEPGG
jgi:hypothetical protein